MTSFNLIDSKWIPVVGKGRVSLKSLFEDGSLYRLSGTPVEKIAVLKLLQAISQAAGTPKNAAEWRAMGENLADFGEKRVKYLEKHCNQFDLYGERPFLQMPALTKFFSKTDKKGKLLFELREPGTLRPFVASGNNTFLAQTQLLRPEDDGSKALILLTQMSFALTSYKVPKWVRLVEGTKKHELVCSGAAMENTGPLHTFLLGNSIRETVWLNTFTAEDIAGLTQISRGLGVPPWECMPKDADDDVARRLKDTLMGRLVPMSRFCLLTPAGVLVSEGVVHRKCEEGNFDPSMLVKKVKGKLSCVLCRPERRPWRELTSLMAFLTAADSHESVCQQVICGLQKLKGCRNNITVWSGGLKVTPNMGVQKAVGSDDFVESEINVPPSEDWCVAFQQEMTALDRAVTTLRESVKRYGARLSSPQDGPRSRKLPAWVEGRCQWAEHLFWERFEPMRQLLVDYCDKPEKASALRRCLVGVLSGVFNDVCPSNTARTLCAWTEASPNFTRYMNGE